jgi:hypothetical protein
MPEVAPASQTIIINSAFFFAGEFVMSDAVAHYWELRLQDVAQALEDNNITTSVVKDGAGARRVVLEEIVPSVAPKSVSWGGSLTVVGSGVYEALKDNPDFEVIDTYDKSLAPDAMVERRRQALLCDLFITGTNAVTEDGWLVNLDMIGNRVGAINFGPRNVVIIVGRNKIVPGLEQAIDRIKDYVAPVNAMRLNKKTPCSKTGVCHDCSSPDRICNVWTVTEKSFPKGRIHVILVNEDMGF